MNEVLMVAGTVVGLLVVIVTLTALFSWLREKRQGYPHEAEIEAAVLPLAYQAIMAAYKSSEYALDELGKRLQGADKAALARAAYGMLPAAIVVRGIVVPVKTVITEQQFSQMVEDAFDRFLVWYNKNCQGFEAAVDKWATVNKP